MIYCFDIDGTICVTKDSLYRESVADQEIINKINDLYEEGHTIIFFTARGASSEIDWTEFTHSQLKGWGVNYHQLITNKKPTFDLLIDDKCINIKEWKESFLKKKRGFVAGAFDLIHPGYVQMWKEAKTVCDYLIVGLQKDPTFDRPRKNKPLLSLSERYEALSAIKYIDEIAIYETEADLLTLLQELELDIRILGEDYRDKEYTGYNINIPVYFCNREHGWSATKLRHSIKYGYNK